MKPRIAKATTVLRPRSGSQTGSYDADQAQLIHALGRRAGQRTPLLENMVLGRDEDCELVLDDEGCSRRHARLGHDGAGGFFVEDLGSRNGTFVNGLPITRRSLTYGDQIALGASTVLLFARSTPLDDQMIQAQKLQMLGELAGGIIHDFNNILGAFTVGLDMLRELCPPEEPILACMSDLQHAAARGTELASQLLGFARAGSIQHEPVDLSKVVADGVRLLQRMVPAAVSLEMDVEPEVGVRGSSSQLLQILVNLAVNGAAAMPMGGKLLIRVTRAGEHAVLEVIDRGVGMDAQTLARARDPFFTTKPRGHGTGLGLATVDRVVREHHGSIDLQSVLGEGTTVVVKLPLTALRAPAESAAAHGPMLEPGTVVLLVDDDPIIRALLRRMLEAAGAVVLLAEDGLVAIELFRMHAERIGVVVLDLDLPRLSGEDTFEVIHELRPQTPVLIASGFLDDERALRLRAAGVSGFQSKPYRRGPMLSAIFDALQPAHGPVPLPRPPALGGGGLEQSALDQDVIAELRQLEPAAPGFLANLVHLYLVQTPDQIRAIEQAADPRERTRAAHMLKSSSMSLGVTQVAALAASIESAARAGQRTDHMLDSLSQAFAAVRPAIEALGAQHSGR